MEYCGSYISLDTAHDSSDCQAVNRNLKSSRTLSVALWFWYKLETVLRSCMQWKFSTIIKIELCIPSWSWIDERAKKMIWPRTNIATSSWNESFILPTNGMWLTPLFNAIWYWPLDLTSWPGSSVVCQFGGLNTDQS